MDQFSVLHMDRDFLVCLKPARVRSTDEPGGMPELCRAALGNPKADVRTVHRLDQVVSGLMVLARGARAASELSRQIREDEFGKTYLAVVHGVPEADSGTLVDLLLRSKPERKTYVVTEPGKGVQEAVLDYEVLATVGDFSMVRIVLRTGRTHQIRCQFSSRNLPLVGDRKYSLNEDNCEIALWSHKLSFAHPATGEKLEFTAPPPEEYPWNLFPGIHWDCCGSESTASE
ncbi:MAG: RluA family pseudouridine synthase [Oscillospiraceae bacterium]|nr:RluA family pseudouridine synthase [Oscillospiraceae bacterium]